MWIEYSRNPSRLFARWRVGVEQCRGCLFKALCLENEKNPVIRQLVLGDEQEEIKEPSVAEQIEDLMYTDPDKIHFRFRSNSNAVDVYYNESLAYRIDRNLYYKLMNGGDDHAEALKDCAR